MLKQSKATARLISLFEISAFFTILGSLLGLLNNLWFGFELLSHFKLQYAISSLILGLIFYLSKRVKLATLMACCLLLNTMFILPWYIDKTVMPSPIQTYHSLKLLLSNVNRSNNNHQALLSLIDKEQPDFIAVLEVDNSWIETLTTLQARYQHKLTLPRDDNFGIAVYSKYPFEQIEARNYAISFIPSIFATIKIQQKPLSIIATHPMPPIGKTMYGARNYQLRELGHYLKTINHSKILMGDLNISMWSDTYHNLSEQGQLTNVRKGFGIHPTWPAQLSLKLAMIPIDHILVSDDIKVTKVKTGPNIGSDHLPLIVEVNY